MSKNVILTLSLIPLVFLFILTALGCSPTDTETEADKISQIEQEINELTDCDFKVPLPEDYPLTYAYLREPPIAIENEVYFIALKYGIEKGALLEPYQDESKVKDIEESQGIRILYGRYEGIAPVMIEYSPVYRDAVVSGVDEVDSWTINGQEVEYYYITRDGKEVITVHLNMGKGGANVKYFLSDKFNEESAKGFTDYLIEQMD